MKVKRYEAMHRDVWDDESGKFVRYEDYAEIQRQLTASEATVTNLTAQVQGLAAENDLILGLAPRYELLPEKHPDWDRAYRIGWNAHQGALEAMRDKMEAPITEAALAEIRAQGVDAFASDLGNAYQQLRAGSPQAKALKAVVFRAASFSEQLRKEASDEQ